MTRRGLSSRVSRRGAELDERGVAGGVRVVDDYAHHPAEIAATLAAVREQLDGRVLALFQPHLYSRTRHLARELGEALAAADVVAVTDVYAAREEPIEGVSGKLVVDAIAERRPGLPLAWTPAVEDGARFSRPGEAGTSCSQSAPATSTAPRSVLEQLG